MVAITQSLDVYLFDQLIGVLSTSNGKLSFCYDETYLQQQTAQPLSLSLPLQLTPFEHDVTHAFFSGLLPDEPVRYQLARYCHISVKNTFALLDAVGSECAGAVALYPPGQTPNDIGKSTHRILEDVEADSILTNLDRHPLFVGDFGIRLSMAGAQNKLMIAFVNGKLAIPTYGTPSTHIIKPIIQGIEDSVFNEFFCMQLAKMIGLTVPETQILWIKEKPYYVVARYDRILQTNNIVKRLHQEDFCQALHIPPEHKYEAEGGPSLSMCFALLADRIQTGTMSGNNTLRLLRAVMFNYLIGNGDAHGKNFSILYRGQAAELAPLYDLMSTVVYDQYHKAKMAMKIAGKYRFNDVRPHHWQQLAMQLGLRDDFLQIQFKKMLDVIADAAQQLHDKLNQSPLTRSAVYAKLNHVISRHSQLI